MWDAPLEASSGDLTCSPVYFSQWAVSGCWYIWEDIYFKRHHHQTERMDLFRTRLLLYFYGTWFHRSVWSCSISEISGDFPDQPITQYLSPWQFPWEFRLPVTQCAPYAGLKAVSGKKWVTWFSTIAPLSLSAWWSYLLLNSLISITAEQGKNHTGMYVKGLFTIHIYHAGQNQTLPISPSPIESHYFSFVTSLPPLLKLTRTDCAYKIWVLLKR